MDKSLLAPGHRACAGCAMPTTIRLVLDAAGPNTIVVSPTGCLEVTTTPFPESSWCVPWLHSLFENASAAASGVEVMLKRRGKDTNVVIIGGDGSTFDIGMGSNSGMFERGHKILYVCYDNEAYMNTGIQRSGATPYDASTTTSPPGRASFGNKRPKKDMPRILAAHGSPYVATASIAYPADFVQKVEKAMQTEGPTYVQVHAPCCTGWGFEGAKTLAIGKLAIETGLWVNYEMVDGEVTKVKKVVKKPVEEYLKEQKRFRHLFKPTLLSEEIAKIQAIADRNFERFSHEIRLPPKKPVEGA